MNQNLIFDDLIHLRHLPMLAISATTVGSCLHWAASGYATTLWTDFWTVFSAQCVGSLEKKKRITNSRVRPHYTCNGHVYNDIRCHSGFFLRENVPGK